MSRRSRDTKPIFPSRHVCEACGSDKNRDAGRSSSGSFARRRCMACEITWRVTPIGFITMTGNGEVVVPAKQYS